MSTSQKITDLTAITTVAAADLITAVDVSDTTMAATGTNKKITADNLMNSIIPQSSTNMMSKGTVYRFDGVYDKIIIPHSADLEIRTGDWAMSFKLKTPSSALAAQKILFAKGASSATGGWNVLYNTDGTITFTAEDDAGTAVYTLTSTALGYATEYDVTITLDRDGSQYIYLNGVADATTAITNSDDLYDSSNRDLGVHANWSGSVSAGLDGCLSELMIMNFAPTAAEVLDLVSGNIPFKWQYGSQTSIVTNGTFTTDTTGWDAKGGATLSVVANQLKVASAGAGGYQKADQDITGIQIGAEYILTGDYDRDGSASEVYFQIGTASGGSQMVSSGALTAASGSYSTQFTATATTMYVNVVIPEGGAGDYAYFDNISVIKLGAVALYDNTSISATTWYDKANGNDGTVTGASVLNPSSAVDSDGNVAFDKGVKVGTGFFNIGAQGAGELTIASGVITATQSFHQVDTEADAASDDLDTINGGVAGDILIIRPASNGRTVVCKDGTGNLELAGDFSLTQGGDTLTLYYLATTWIELSRSDNGA